MKELWELIKTIVTTPAGLMAFFGLVLLTLGAAGGIRYSGWLPIDEGAWRIAFGLLGTALLGFAAWRASTISVQALLTDSEIKALDIKIVAPRHDEVVGDRLTVKVTSEKPIPKGYELRVLRGYPGDLGVVPNAKLIKSSDKLEWDAYDFDIGSSKGDARSIEAWLVGPDGSALLTNWETNHRSTTVPANVEIRRLAKIAKEPGLERWLPPITSVTKDMFKVRHVIVKKA